MTGTQQPTRIPQNADTDSMGDRASSQSNASADAPSAKTLKESGLSNPLNLVPGQHSRKTDLENDSDGRPEAQMNKPLPGPTDSTDFTQNVVNAADPKA